MESGSTLGVARKRDAWDNRTSYLAAASASAIGLGNLFRYPSQVWANYGLQWFIPYGCSLVLIGIPLLGLEMVLGQIARSGNIAAFGRIHPALRGMGLASQVCGYIVPMYYNVLISYALFYLLKSFVNPLPWTANGGSADNVSEYFYDEVLQYSSINGGDPAPSVVVPSLYGLTVFVWIAIYAALFRGPSVMGKVSMVTTAISVLMLFVIVIRACTLPNAWDGIKLYIGTWRSSNLATTSVWTSAAGQVFFSTGICQGVFSAYASYADIYENTVEDAYIVALANAAYEVIGGFAAFGIAGFLAMDPNTVKLNSYAVGFVTYPQAIATLPGANAWSFFFFLTVFLLGWDSSWSLLETLATSLYDARWFSSVTSRRWGKELILGGMCIVGALASLLYCTSFGLDAIGAVDQYVTELGLIVVGFMYCFGISYLYRFRDVVQEVGWVAFSVHCATYLIAPIFGVVIGYASTPLTGFVSGLIGGTIGFASAHFLANNPETDMGYSEHVAKLYWLNFYTCDQFRKDVDGVLLQAAGNRPFPTWWVAVLRFATAPILLGKGNRHSMKEGRK
ncbi:Sodium:neurotransmitter symporter [Gonapodya prolifera JEL478]|uniref:Sodium:neurotransmitter symporter n=1 Tax=Gonapodya prolifera (strain JEL478) TaxID=1344416 RepID=A0A139B0M6_GONPJ|nr:Sodium:neurotransmitter symporter [Gonapodya prolifera JEL478]|eukprot:KXS22548.1 Sodium:neurotransmitter symporter [Gonapodya prolifera JEL478]